MDSINHHTCPIGIKGNGKTPMVFIQLGGLYKVELIRKGGIAKMARLSFQDHSPPNKKIVQGVLF